MTRSAAAAGMGVRLQTFYRKRSPTDAGHQALVTGAPPAQRNGCGCRVRRTFRRQHQMRQLQQQLTQPSVRRSTHSIPVTLNRKPQGHAYMVQTDSRVQAQERHRGIAP